jgi:hypothetical protein
MTANETPRVSEGIEESAGRRLPSSQVNSGYRYFEEPWRAEYERNLTHWSQGFQAAWDYLSPLLDRANAAADFWYLRANHSPAEIREMQLAAMDEGWRAYWDAGMPSGVSYV